MFALIPLVAFYWIESNYGLTAGVVVALAFALAELIWHRIAHGKLNKLVLFTAVLIATLGGLSVLNDDERFMLYSPAVGDAVFGGLLLGALVLGKNPLAAAMREQDPEVDVHPLQERFLKGLTLRLVVNFAVHAAATVWAAEQERETWLFVSGPLQYILFGVQFAAEVMFGRFVVLPRVEAAEAAEKQRPSAK